MYNASNWLERDWLVEINKLLLHGTLISCEQMHDIGLKDWWIERISMRDFFSGVAFLSIDRCNGTTVAFTVRTRFLYFEAT